MHLDATVAAEKPSLRKRLMKKLTRDRVTPIISARVSHQQSTFVESNPDLIMDRQSRKAACRKILFVSFCEDWFHHRGLGDSALPASPEK
jgi:hypothetical protein